MEWATPVIEERCPICLGAIRKEDNPIINGLRVIRKGEIAHLTGAEMCIFSLLNEKFSSSETLLSSYNKGKIEYVGTDSLKTHIFNIRKKISALDGIIVSRNGHGYRLLWE